MSSVETELEMWHPIAGSMLVGFTNAILIWFRKKVDSLPNPGEGLPGLPVNGDDNA